MERSFVMPHQFTTTDFGLSEAEKNKSEYHRLRGSDYRILFENGGVVLGVISTGDMGELFVLNQDDETLAYYATFKRRNIDGIGDAATDVSVWRRAAPGIENLSDHVFDGFFLRDFDAVVSDTQYTEKGFGFWIDLLGEAHDRGFRVGYIRDGEVILFNGSGSIYHWVRSHSGAALFVSKPPVPK